jgi:hypothetical protein
VSAREKLLRTLRKNAEEADSWNSPMYSLFCRRMAEDVESDGPTWALLEPYADEPAEEYFPFRDLAGSSSGLCPPSCPRHSRTLLER